MNKVKPCNYMRLASTFAAREMGCPLDHCQCGTHDNENVDHECKFPEYDEDVVAAERAAGWDPNP